MKGELPVQFEFIRNEIPSHTGVVRIAIGFVLDHTPNLEISMRNAGAEGRYFGVNVEVRIRQDFTKVLFALPGSIPLNISQHRMEVSSYRRRIKLRNPQFHRFLERLDSLIVRHDVKHSSDASTTQHKLTDLRFARNQS